MRKHFLFLLLCLAGLAGPLCGQNGRALFNYVEHPTLSPRQQHFLQIIEKNPVNESFRLVTVNHELFKGNAPIVLNLDGLAIAGRTEINIRQVEREQRGDAEYSWRGSVDGWPLA
ncbi:MAG: hypothetical protein ABIQ93_10680, partial [Saprospiraceae bacterium]